MIIDSTVLQRESETSNYSWLVERIADDLFHSGFSINPLALSHDIAPALLHQVETMTRSQFQEAAIGRELQQEVNTFVRTDKTCWIDGSSSAGKLWLDFAELLRTQLNYSLQLGLFSFESHFAIYQQNDFYKRHLDAFKGKRNRIVSVVLYLNSNWQHRDGGELVLYQDTADLVGTRVLPTLGTLVCFLSEAFPHEVLPANRSRYSVAGWFRVNGSMGDQLDPPR